MIDQTVRIIGSKINIDPSVNIAKNVEIISDDISIGRNTTIGENTKIIAYERLVIGENCKIRSNAQFKARIIEIGDFFYSDDNPRPLIIGGGGAERPTSIVKIGKRCVIHDSFINSPVEIGDDVGMSPSSDISTHGFWNSVLDGFGEKHGPVKIGNGTIIGYRALILANVTIGKNVTVGADAVVTRDIPDCCVVAGVPAKIIAMSPEYPKQLTYKEKETLIRKILDEYFELLKDKIKDVEKDGDKISGMYKHTPFSIEYFGEEIVVKLNMEHYMGAIFNIYPFDKEWSGIDNDISDDLRDFLRHYGIRIFSTRHPVSLPSLIKTKLQSLKPVVVKSLPNIPYQTDISNLQNLSPDTHEFKMKIAIVTEFHQDQFYQWTIALTHPEIQKHFGIITTQVIASKIYRDVRSLTDSYWNPIREADVVFIYSTRVDSFGEWWKLPLFCKQLMRPDAKMVCQSDDEFSWLWYPDWTWWNNPNTGNKWETPKINCSPERFFEDTGILEVADAHLTVVNDPKFMHYTNKPVYNLLLPHLVRYNIKKYSISQFSFKYKSNRNIAIMWHGCHESKIDHILKNIIIPNKLKATIFSWAHKPDPKTINLTKGSHIYDMLPQEAYMDIMWRECSVGLDDNTAYIGWSRFVMECAIVHIPCIGSTDAVKLFFPELYTEHKDSEKQIELIRKLQTDERFYQDMAVNGYERCMKYLSTQRLCEKLMKIFEDINTPRTYNVCGIDKENEKKSSVQKPQNEMNAAPHP